VCREPIVLKPIRSDLHYRGLYDEIAFELLTTPAPLYRSLLNHLGPFGATTQSLKFESPSISDSNATCTLADLNAAIRIRLERMEIDFWKLHEISADTANQIVQGAWKAIIDTRSVGMTSQVVELNVVTEIQGASYSALMKRYVMIPEALGPVDAGVAFYARPVPEGEAWSNVVLDRIFGQDGQLVVKMTMGMPSTKVGLDQLAVAVTETINTTFHNLGLEFPLEVGQ